jgi:GT2 family glycosyltransferase
MVEAAESDRAIGAVGATMLRYSDPDILETAAGGTFSEWHGMGGPIRAGSRRTAPRPPIERLDYISGACLLIPARVVERAGLMDERYFLYGEDVEWGARIRDAGFGLAYCAEAEVWHKGSASTVRRSELHDYYNVKSPLLLVQKRHPRRLPAAFAYSVGRCVLPKIVRGEWQRLRSVWRAYRDFANVLRGRGETENRSDTLSTSKVLSSP